MIRSSIAFALVLGLVALGGCKKQESNRGREPVAGSATEPTPMATPDAPPAPVAPATEVRHVEVAFMDRTIKVTAKVPVSWNQREGNTSWDPPEVMSLPWWHRSYDIQATCGGACTDSQVDHQVDLMIDSVRPGHEKPNVSSDPARDAVRAPVKELERGDLPQGGKYVLLRVEQPVGVPDAKEYADVFAGTCITHRKGSAELVVTHIQAAPDEEKTWWPVLVDACKATTVEDAPAAAPVLDAAS